MSAVQVCTNDAGERSVIQGIRVWSTSFNAAGAAAVSTTPLAYEASSCKKWTVAQSCAKGAVVDGVHLLHGDGALQGFKLSCRSTSLPLKTN